MSKSDNVYEVIIIGGGPAGIACATQLQRFGMQSIIIEKEDIGGLIKNAGLIENYPGFPAGITGEYFVRLLKKQVKYNDLNIKFDEVVNLTCKDDIFTIHTRQSQYFSKYVILACGTLPLIPDTLKSQIKKFKNIHFNVCDFKNIRNSTFGIIGAGDCAFDYAMQLCDENKVLLLNRGKNIKALKILQDRIEDAESVKYFDNTSIIDITKSSSRLILESDSQGLLEVDFLLIAVGRRSNLDFVDKEILQNPNLFQIGDVKNGRYRQLSIAVGDGTYSAMKINNIEDNGLTCK